MRHAAVLVCALALGGCYESKAPLIAPSEAEFPFADGTRYVFYEWNAENRHWDTNLAGSLTREGDHYDQFDETGYLTETKSFRLKAIGGGYYIAQQENDQVYVYDLIRVDGDIVYEFGMPCRDEDEKFLGSRLIDSFTKDSPYGNTCAVSDFAKLAQAFRAIAAKRPQPQGKYALMGNP